MVGAKLDHIRNSFTNILLRRVVVGLAETRALAAVLFYPCMNGTRRAYAFLVCAAASQFTTYAFIINYNRTCERCELTSFASAPAPAPASARVPYAVCGIPCASCMHQIWFLSFVSLSLGNVCSAEKGTIHGLFH